MAALAAAVVLAVVAGTAAVIAVQAKANAKLRSANVCARRATRASGEPRNPGHRRRQEVPRRRRERTHSEEQPDAARPAQAPLEGAAGLLQSPARPPPGRRDTRPESLARLARASFALGKLTNEIGDKQDALIAYRESLAIFQKLADGSPQDTVLQGELATNLDNFGALLGDTGKTDEAMSALESSLAIRQKLVNVDPQRRSTSKGNSRPRTSPSVTC